MILRNDQTLRVERNRIRLLDGDSLLLSKHAGAQLRAYTCVEAAERPGMLWITEEGEPDDVFLRPGEAYRLRGQGRVVATAWGAVQLRVVSAREVAAEARETRQRERQLQPGRAARADAAPGLGSCAA
jgi:hypothetical protein